MCKCIFKKNKPKRTLFFWDIIATIILTSHDIVALVLAIIAASLNDHVQQYPIYNRWQILLLILFMLSCDMVIVVCIVEFGYRLLEPGPLLGKFVIGYFHVMPSVLYIGHIQHHFLYYLGWFKDGVIIEPDPYWKRVTFADGLMEMYGISVFHHIYVVLFVTVSTLVGMCIGKIQMKRKLSKGIVMTDPEEENLEFLATLPPSVKQFKGPICVELKLDSETRDVTIGSKVSGRVVITGTIPEGSPPTSYSIEIEGTGNIFWKAGCCLCCKDKPFDAHEVYIQEVQEGETFSFLIPKMSAPSIIAKNPNGFGKIQYNITAQVFAAGIQFFLVMPILVRPIKVSQPISPSPDPLIFYNEAYLMKLFGFLNFQRGPISCELTVEKMQFVSGEDITFTAKFTNKSRRVVENISVSIASDAWLMDKRGKEKATTIIWKEMTYGALTNSAEPTWSATMTVPPLTESASLPPTPYVNYTNYVFRVRMIIQGLTEDLVVDCPITIGPPPPPPEKQFPPTASPSKDIKAASNIAIPIPAAPPAASQTHAAPQTNASAPPTASAAHINEGAK